MQPRLGPDMRGPGRFRQDAGRKSNNRGVAGLPQSRRGALCGQCRFQQNARFREQNPGRAKTPQVNAPRRSPRHTPSQQNRRILRDSSPPVNSPGKYKSGIDANAPAVHSSSVAADMDVIDNWEMLAELGLVHREH